MSVNWHEIQQALSPIKDYEDLCRRFQTSFAFSFVRQTFDFSLPDLVSYTQRLLGGDTRGRYAEYTTRLVGTLSELHQAGIRSVLVLVSRTASRNQLEAFSEQSGIPAPDIVTLLKYLIYWFIPGEKYLSGLVRDDPASSAAIKVLGEAGVRTNLQLLQRALTPAERKELAESTNLPEAIIAALVHRADFSRLPWTSKATISNIIGAGYGSLAALANADAEQLYTDFFRYGKSIGKNLKLGNEIENSYRIARIVPVLIHED